MKLNYLIAKEHEDFNPFRSWLVKVAKWVSCEVDIDKDDALDAYNYGCHPRRYGEAIKSNKRWEDIGSLNNGQFIGKDQN